MGWAPCFEWVAGRLGDVCVFVDFIAGYLRHHDDVHLLHAAFVP